MKRTIFPTDFAPYYPLGIQPCPMYVDVANHLYYLITEIGLDMPNAEKLKKEIAINLAIYFEDKMSSIGLWNTFIEIHKQLYTVSLPFYGNLFIPDKDEVNEKEIGILIWLVISRNFRDRFINPLALIENETIDKIMDILNEEDDVEVNEALYEFIYNKDKAKDYFKQKNILFWLRRSYLLCSPLSDERYNEYFEIFENKLTKSEAAYYAETAFSMTSEIGPIAIRPDEWLSEMYVNNGMRKEGEKLKKLEYCPQGVFHVIKADEKHAILKDTKGEERRVKNAFPDLFYTGSYVNGAFVKYGKNDWEMNGFVIKSDKDTYDKSTEKKRQLDMSYERLLPLYTERANGKRMAFCENKKQLKEWLRKVAPELNFSELDYRMPSGSYVAFISSKAGIIIATDIIHVVKSDDNPYYRKCDARTLQSETLSAIANIEAVHPELLNYLLDNDMLQDGDLSAMAPSELGNKIFTQYIDFIARNHRRHHYHDHDY